MSKSKKKLKGRVIHDYEPEAITFGQIPVAVGEDGWTEVFIVWSQKKGVIPSDFIEVYEEPEPLYYTESEAKKIITPFFHEYKKKKKMKSKLKGKKFQNINDLDYLDEFSNIKTRNNLIREILETERTYVNYMTLLIEFYVKPLRSKKIIDENTIKKIFSNVEQIHQINSVFFQALEKGMVNFPQQQSFGNSVKKIAPFFKSYTTYVNNFQTARETFANLEKTNPKFQEFVMEVYQKKEILNQKFNSLLIMPVQRLPRYKMLFEQILKYTPEDHVERTNIEEALLKVSEIADFVNQNQKNLENQKVLIQISSMLKDKYPTLVQPYRQYKKEGLINLSMIERKIFNDTYKLYLFSDLIVLLEEKPNVKVKKLNSFFILLPFSKIQDVEKNTDFILEAIIEGKNSVFLISCPSEIEKSDWLSMMKQTYEDGDNFLERKGIKDSYLIGLERGTLLSTIEETRSKLLQTTLTFNQTKSQLFTVDRELIVSERQLEELKKKTQQLKDQKKRVEDEMAFLTNSYQIPKDHLLTNLNKLTEMDPFYMETLKEEKTAFQAIFNDEPVTHETVEDIKTKYPDLILPPGVYSQKSPPQRSSSIISRPLPLPQPKTETLEKREFSNLKLPTPFKSRQSFIEPPKNDSQIKQDPQKKIELPTVPPKRKSIHDVPQGNRGSIPEIRNLNIDQNVSQHSPDIKRRELPKIPPKK